MFYSFKLFQALTNRSCSSKLSFGFLLPNLVAIESLILIDIDRTIAKGLVTWRCAIFSALALRCRVVDSFSLNLWGSGFRVWRSRSIVQ